MPPVGAADQPRPASVAGRGLARAACWSPAASPKTASGARPGPRPIACSSQLTDWLRRSRAVRSIEIDEGWSDDRDVSVFVGRWAWLDVRALVEEHGGGKTLVRVSTHLRPTTFGIVTRARARRGAARRRAARRRSTGSRRRQRPAEVAPGGRGRRHPERRLDSRGRLAHRADHRDRPARHRARDASDRAWWR